MATTPKPPDAPVFGNSPFNTFSHGNDPAPCVRFETGDASARQASHVVPYHQLVVCLLNTAETEMVIKFGMGDYIVTGQNLRPVHSALQRHNIDYLDLGKSADEDLSITSIVFRDPEKDEDPADYEPEPTEP